MTSLSSSSSLLTSLKCTTGCLWGPGGLRAGLSVGSDGGPDVATFGKASGAGCACAEERPGNVCLAEAAFSVSILLGPSGLAWSAEGPGTVWGAS